MERKVQLIKNLQFHIGKKITLGGWILKKRDLGSIYFLEVTDGTGIIQVIINRDSSCFYEGKKAGIMSSVYLTGIVNQHEDRLEVICESLSLLGITNNKSISPFVANFLNNRTLAIMRIRQEVIKSIRIFFEQRDFLMINPPLILPDTGKEGCFSIDFFGRPAVLSQSSALWMVAYALAFNRVYSIHPIFRAEHSKTRKHLAEFWMLEAEVVHFDFEQIMELLEELIKFVVQRVLSNLKFEVKLLNRTDTLKTQIARPFIKITYDEVVSNLHERDYSITWGQGLGRFEKLVSVEQSSPIFVTNFPIKIGSWTAKLSSNKTSFSFNLLAPEGVGEIAEGCQRINDYKIFEKKFEAAQIDHLDWFIEVNKNLHFVHSGFGIGIERLCMWICGIDHIKETVGFPRMVNKLNP